MLPGPTVLLVEDDRDIRESLADVLRDEGYAVTEAANGQEALRMLETGPLPQLILLDLMMPVMDGRVFLRQRSTNPALSAIPVVVVSANRDTSESLPVCGYIDKPVRLRKLLDVVGSHCLVC